MQSKLRKTIVFVTHDIQEAFRLGTKVGVMNQGKLLKVAKPIDLFADEQDPFVKNFVGMKGIFDVLELVSVNQALIRECPIFHLGQAVEAALVSLGNWDYGLLRNDKGDYCGKLNRGRLLEGNLQGTVTEEMSEPSGPLISSEDTLHHAIELMVASGWSWLPVKDRNERLCGIITLESCSLAMRVK